MDDNRRKNIAIALLIVAILALFLYVLSKSVQGTQSNLFLIGAVVAGAVAILSGFKDIIELVDRILGNPDSAEKPSQQPTNITIEKVEVALPSAETEDEPEPDPLPAALERYLKWVHKTYGRLDLRGVEERQQKIHRLTLADVYVSLRATLDSAEEADDDTKSSRRFQRQEQLERSVDMRDLFAESKYIAITGGPGCGKTTYLNIIAGALADAHLRNDATQVQQFLGFDHPLPVPIFVTLADYNRYRREFSRHENTEFGTVRGYINRIVCKRVRHLPTHFFDRLLDGDTPVIVLLDGLDEVADDAERRQVSRELQALVDGGEVDYLVVTSRTRAYQGHVRLADLRLAEVEPMTLEQVNQLVRRWCNAVYETEDERASESQSLTQSIAALEARRQARNEPPLVDTPLMVTVVAIVHYNEHRLPEQRAALYMKCVDVLLAEKHHKPTEGGEELKRWGGSLAAKRQFLALLAFRMMGAGEQAGRSVADRQLRDWLLSDFESEYGTDDARRQLREFVHAMRSRESIVKEVDRRYSFVHLTFQEFLAAYYLAETVRAEDDILAEMVADERAAQSWWRETILLTLGYLGLSSKRTALSLMRRLGQVIGSDEMQLASAELAATAFVELESQDEQTRKHLHDRLVDLLTTRNRDLQPASRLLAGDALARLGDRRPGIGVIEHNGVLIPDIAWGAWVSAGEYTIGDENPKYDDEKRRPATLTNDFRLATYPVTYIQFQTFLDSADYDDSRWWQDIPEAEKQMHDPQWSIASRPRETVSWYQAIAFCRWLSDKLNNDIDLPHEHEWEVAARYPHDTVYPWGDDFDPNKANTGESNLKQTTAVGIFPDGVNHAHDLLDLSGNVWEWCRNAYSDTENTNVGSAARTLRGGSWVVTSINARVAFRFRNNPDFRINDFGFRCVVRRPPSQGH